MQPVPAPPYLRPSMLALMAAAKIRIDSLVYLKESIVSLPSHEVFASPNSILVLGL